jgi:hypothetical protein
VVLPDHVAFTLALWLAHTYVTEVTDYTPYILVTSPVRECGKSTLLEVLSHLANRAQMTGGITAAGLYRRIHRLSPTMLVDELDTRLRGDSGELLRGVLNTGFHRSGKVTICVGEQHDDQDFNTFCPKVLAGIGRAWDTVTSRSIPVRLTRATPDEIRRLKKIRGDQISAVCEPYRRRLLRWSCDARGQLRLKDAVTPDALSARQCDVWRPLLAIADVADGQPSGTAREAALALSGAAQEEGDTGLLLLEDLRELFRASGKQGLYSEWVVQELTKREDRPWPEYRGDKPISKRGLASLLGRFGVKPRTVRDGAETAKGYRLEDLAPVFRTYLVAPHTAISNVTSVTTDHSAPGNAACVTDVTDRVSGIGASPEDDPDAFARAAMREGA